MMAYLVKRTRGNRTEWSIKFRRPGETTWKIRKADRVARDFKIGLEVKNKRQAEQVAPPFLMTAPHQGIHLCPRKSPEVAW